MDLRKFQDEMAEWQAKTFPNQDVISKIQHLKEEVGELLENPSDYLEMADCVMLLCGIAAIQNIDLASACEEKFKINQTRKWGAPDNNGVVHHIKE